jgi:hypothetical protein
MGREIQKKTPKGAQKLAGKPQRKYKNKKLGKKPQIGRKITRFKKSRHGNNPRKAIPTKPWWPDGPGQSGMKTLTSTELDNNNIVEDLDQQNTKRKR